MALPRELSKTKLSLYLRTQCDKELYLSLFKGNVAAFKAAGMPAPLKSRPNVQLITGAGMDFEKDQYKMLVTRMASHVRYAPSFSPLNLATALAAVPTPCACIQPQVDLESFRGAFLSRIGLTPPEQALIPTLNSMRPDLVLVRASIANDWEILPTGNRAQRSTDDGRRALSVVDLKNVSEANASYAAEVCLYAVVLANWLVHVGLADKFYVSASLYLWTRPELASFEEFHTKNPAAPGDQLLLQLIAALERDALDFLQFMPSVRKFFKEDVPRVITKGDAGGWGVLEYHVGSRCSACDWLGHRDWLSKPDETVYLANPTHYCVARAESTQHLSRVPNLSRGARKVLEAHAIPDVTALCGVAPASAVLTQHTFLKRERRALARKATAILSSTLTLDSAAKIVTLARNASLQINVTVAFDASAGRIAGIGFHASFLPPFGSTSAPAQLARRGFLVARDSDAAEWAVIQAFIDSLVGAVDAAAAKLSPGGSQRPKAQIYFWESRQYEELCKAFGRHLASVLGMKSTRQQALAWLFPAEDLLERDDGAISPAIVFVQDIVERVLNLPVTHVNTLLRVAHEYHHAKLVPNKIDTFYSEPFSNGIPRERTFEIWMNTSGSVNWGSNVTLPLSDAMHRYERVLADNAFALYSVVARLRADFKGSIKGDARPLVLSTIVGKSGVAFDSKMWSQWKRLDSATRAMESAGELASAGERLEATYRAIVLTKVRKSLGSNRYEFDVSPESLEAKIDAPSLYLTFGLIARPGFPLETGYSLGLNTIDPAIPAQQLAQPMHRIMRVSLEQFDRAARTATARITASWSGVQLAFDAVFAGKVVDLSKDALFLLAPAPYDDASVVDGILEAIGDPSNATPDPNAIRALGKIGKTLKPGVDAPTMASRILWGAAHESKRVVRQAAVAKSFAQQAATLAAHGLNASQRSAVHAAAQYGLSILWGPPGTGKTDTLTAFVHALVNEARGLKVGRKVLLTGPNYRAIEVLADRVLTSLRTDAGAICGFFRAYSKSHELPPPIALPAHIQGGDVSLGVGRTGYAQLETSIRDPDTITVVATTSHVVDKVAELLDPLNTLVDAFDVVVIDESSQVDITLALRAIAALKPNAQLVVAGDHLQMPPIAIVDPPVNAEYLVGSIQTYLIDRFNLSPSPLLINYRSNRELVDYALSLGYPPTLKANEPGRRLHEVSSRATALAGLPSGLPTSSAWEALLDPARPVCCLLHDDETASQASANEAKMVAALVFGLYKCMSDNLDPLPSGTTHSPLTPASLFERAVGIVTPHKAQRAAILTELALLFPTVPRDVMAQSVDTVERFQGGERHTILVSFGVGDIEVIQGEEEFLLQLQRINVAVSRAMAKCIVLLPQSLAYHLPSEKKVLRTAKAIKSYVEEFCAQRQKETIHFSTTSRACEVRWHA